MNDYFDPFSSRKLIAQELVSRGWQESTLTTRDGIYVQLISPWDRQWIFPRSVVWYPFVQGTAVRISKAKDLAYRYVQQLGVTIPATLELPIEQRHIDEFLRRYKLLVVKPQNAHGSHGVTLNISTTTALEQAIKDASRYSVTVLLQKQFTGDEIRFTIIHGKVVSVLLRQTPRVVGDGVTSVADLIVRENNERTKIGLPYITYPPLDAEIISNHFVNSQQVLAAGKLLELSKSTMVKGGASLLEISDKIHQTYIDTVQNLATQTNPKFMVIDMMLRDYTSAQTEDNYTFIECNTAPALKMYYSARHGKTYNIVPIIADMVEEALK